MLQLSCFSMLVKTMDARQESYVDISSFAADMLAASDAGKATRLFKSLLASFGYDTFSCGETDLRDYRRSVFYVVDWPQAFADIYHAGDMIASCPIMQALPEHNTPYCWADMREHCFKTKGSWRLLEAARAYGWDDGLVVPLARGGNRKGIVSMMGPSAKLQAGDRPLVAALATIYYERVRGMLAGTRGLTDSAKLTSHEIDCLRLVAAGLPDAAVAGKLETSQTSVNELVHGARLKLGARTRAEAVAIVVSLGLVTI